MWLKVGKTSREMATETIVRGRAHLSIDTDFAYFWYDAVLLFVVDVLLGFGRCRCHWQLVPLTVGCDT